MSAHIRQEEEKACGVSWSASLKTIWDEWRCLRLSNDTHHKSPRMLKPKTHNHLNWQTKFLEKDSTKQALHTWASPEHCLITILALIPFPEDSISWSRAEQRWNPPFLCIRALWQAGCTLHLRADMGGDAIHIFALAALSENTKTLGTVRRIYLWSRLWNQWVLEYLNAIRLW